MELKHAAFFTILTSECHSKYLVENSLVLLLFSDFKAKGFTSIKLTFLLRLLLFFDRLCTEYHFRLLSDVIENVLETTHEKFLTAVFEHKEAHLQYCFPTRDEEIVPKLKNLLTHFSLFTFYLHILDAVCEDSDEPCRCEVARIDHLIFEVRMQIGLENGN